MPPRKPWFPRKWHTGDVCALAFLLIGLFIVLFVAATDGQYATWTLWFAVPMIMLSLGYLFIVSALPLWLGPRSGEDLEEEEPPKTRGE